jgi:hypothetical protein
MTELDNALADIAQVRHYTTALINTIDPADWFRMPAGGVTHVAWQVGHIAMAQYRLCLERVRGVRPEDEALISSEFLKQFGRDSVPDPITASTTNCAARPPASPRLIWQARFTRPTAFARPSSIACSGPANTRCCMLGRSACCGDCSELPRCGETPHYALPTHAPPTHAPPTAHPTSHSNE